MASVFRLRLRENPFLAWWGALSDALVGATFEHAAILQRDVSYASRTLVRSKGWTAVAVLSLGLGIGANAALFSVVESNLLAKLPVDRPDELVTLGWRGNNPAATDRSFWGYWAEAADRGKGSFSYAAFGQLRDVTRTLDGNIGYPTDTTTAPRSR
jgi:hypothetical protein